MGPPAYTLLGTGVASARARHNSKRGGISMPDIHESQIDGGPDFEPATAAAEPGSTRKRRRRTGDLPNLLAQATVPMTVLAQDPDVTGRRGPVNAGIPVPSSRLQRGPANHRFHVVDVGVRGAPAAVPVRLTARGKPWQYVDRWARQVRSTDLAGVREFRAQNVFAIAAHTLALFERHLGRRVPWRSGWPQLYLVPQGMLGANAAYTPERHAIAFGYLPALGGRHAAYACMSYDVIAHEVTHAVLDGLRPRYVEPGLPDQLAFHEALADLVAMLSVFELRGVAERLLLGASHADRLHFATDQAAAAIKDKKGRLAARIAGRRDWLKENALLGLGEELGRARALRAGQQDLGPGMMPLRRSVDLEPDATLLDRDEFAEPHRRAEI